MAAETESTIKNLLEAPVGSVLETISAIIKKPACLTVTEQNSVGSFYQRKIVIGYDGSPILYAVVKFDSKNLPPTILAAILQKKEGIGEILRKNKIPAQRKSLNTIVDSSQKVLTRDYEILFNNLTLFQISEKIYLEFLSSSKYC
jgi:chorismate-pyruvate lyase